ncbi:hypothetical protein NDN08_007951 [Rhodosorus marinus]|uniref:Uncharacterized protein n=1 Tax=Rhodosorus marinus TaxID=101924 RepID=A0AAV8V2L5_9RHOD|nr:hypothetical protein NDN08_007951 [Rhodosorus marinus]
MSILYGPGSADAELQATDEYSPVSEIASTPDDLLTRAVRKALGTLYPLPPPYAERIRARLRTLTTTEEEDNQN